MADWDPALYQQFQAERAAPFYDLMGLLREPVPNMRIVDLGCGTGELTALLPEAFPGSLVVGVDSSPAMLAKAAPHASARLTFEQDDLSRLDGEWDLIFSNAALHWIPDHPALLQHLYDCLVPGGQLAVQVPTNHGHPSQVLMAEVAATEPFGSALNGWRKSWSVLDLHGYGEVLYGLGGVSIVLLEKLYPQVVENAEAIVRFTESTAMRPYLDRLPTEFHDSFRQTLIDRLSIVIPGSPVFFGFKRLLFTVRKLPI